MCPLHKSLSDSFEMQATSVGRVTHKQPSNQKF